MEILNHSITKIIMFKFEQHQTQQVYAMHYVYMIVEKKWVTNYKSF